MTGRTHGQAAGRGEGTFALFAGGGTAGHVLPGIAVANELTARGHPASSIQFVGASVGNDRQLVERAGYAFTGLPGRGIQRRLTIANLAAVLGIARATIAGVGLVRRLRPSVVVMTGSYAAVPCIVGAVIWRVPMVVLARDARAGAADRLAGRFAKASAVPFSATDLPRATVTGNPVRSELLAIDREADRPAAREQLALPQDRTVVAVFTGSLGSRRVNRAVRGLVERWGHRTDVAIRHAVGSRDWQDYARDLPEPAADGLVYQPIEYEEHMDLLLAAADLAVTRAGGATVAELAAVGMPAILVPLPIAPRDHQTANARALVEAEAAILVPDPELDANRLESELESLVDDPARRARMAACATAIAHPEAAARVADLVERCARP